MGRVICGTGRDGWGLLRLWELVCYVAPWMLYLSPPLCVPLSLIALSLGRCLWVRFSWMLPLSAFSLRRVMLRGFLCAACSPPLWDEGAVVLAGLCACGAALPLCAALASCALGEDECVFLLLRDGEAGG